MAGIRIPARSISDPIVAAEAPQLSDGHGPAYRVARPIACAAKVAAMRVSAALA